MVGIGGLERVEPVVLEVDEKPLLKSPNHQSKRGGINPTNIG